MGRTALTGSIASLLLGLLLFQPDPSPVHARTSASLHLQEAASSDTVEAPEDSAAADTLADDLSSEVRVASGLSTITGGVTLDSSSDPLSGAIITLHRLRNPDADGLSTQSDDHGRFRFQGVPSGEYLVKTHHIGYRDRVDTISVGHRDLLALEVPVTTEAVELPPLEVEVQSAWLAQTGFYWRKERGLGKFLTPKDVDQRSATNFGELVRMVPGVRVMRRCDGSFPCDRVLRMRQTNDYRRCQVKYFMDGRPMHGQVNPKDISAHDIAAVEVYRNISETPAQYYGRCGSIVMWSKRYDPNSNDP